MKYMGSKARHAKEILAHVLRGRKEGQVYVEPFVGGANMLDKVTGPRIAADVNTPLITMWKALTEDGWVPPSFVSEDDYEKAKTTEDLALKAYIGFSLSFGGKYFGGYRRDIAGTKGCIDNMKTQSRRSYAAIMEQKDALQGVVFVNRPYDELYIPSNSIIYCDPPYRDTTKYATGGFDHDKFWVWCESKVDEGHKVFVSEYTAPEHWKCVWSKEVNNTLVKDTGSKRGVEKLFTLTKETQI